MEALAIFDQVRENNPAQLKHFDPIEALDKLKSIFLS